MPDSPSHFNPTTGLTWGDVAIDSHTHPTMIQKVSKCDQFGAGSNIIVGRTESLLCPVTAILKFRGDQPGPFFIDSSRKALSKQKFVGQIREILNSLSLQQDQYAGHSFRIGAATTWKIRQSRHSAVGTVRHFCSIFVRQKSI